MSPPLLEEGSDFFLWLLLGGDYSFGCFENILDKKPPDLSFFLSEEGIFYCDNYVTIDLFGDNSSGLTTLIVLTETLVPLSPAFI